MPGSSEQAFLNTLNSFTITNGRVLLALHYFKVWIILKYEVFWSIFYYGTAIRIIIIFA